MPNTKLLYCPELGAKLRISGVNNYVTKLYDLGPGMLDGAQTTALNQPYLSGNIAPTEKYALKNNIGTDLWVTHTPISFSATDKWSISTAICVNKYTGNIWYIGKSRYSTDFLFGIDGSNLRFSIYINGVQYNGVKTLNKFFGKTIIITLSAFGNNVLSIYINGILFETIAVPTNVIIGILGSSYNSANTINGTISYHCIRDIALSPTQVAGEYNYLRTLFPEIESVQIGTQTWATSNCEMTCTPQGNVIREMQAATNVEKITNYVNREFSSDTGFWYKGGPTPPTIVGGMCNINCPDGSDSYIAANIPLIIGRYYKVIYSIKRNSAGSLSVFSGGGTPIDSSVGDTKVAYFIANHSSSFALGRRVSPTDIDIDNVYVQEVGWSDSTNLYNYVYANTIGTAEQKDYAAVKAAAMWCHYNNDPALGAVYGKLYNWYAVKLLQMDIDYYNAANPTTPWGWRVPTSVDYLTLAGNLGGMFESGGKLKKEGTNYWNSPNTGANNQSNFTSLGQGNRSSAGVFSELNNLFNTHNIDESFSSIKSDSKALFISGADDKVIGMGLRLIKSSSDVNDTLHGFEYTPGQNDDIVTFIGNPTHNTNKTIQSLMRPFEELISTKDRFYLSDDVTKRIDGSASNLMDPNYLQKVSIPEFWYGARFDSVRNKVQVWFSLVPVPGFMHIAQQSVCRYPGYIDGTGKARSHSGFKYPNNKNLIEFTTACQLTSEDLFVLPYYTYNALSLLLLHDIGRRNAQAVWAGLQTGSTYSNITSGKTDVLTTPSGEVPADAETASNKPFRWRFIENLYGDCWKILSGVYCNQVGADRRVMVCPDPYKSNTSSVISADYVQACIIAAGEGWLKDTNLPWINAKSYGASSTTGYCDYTYNNTADKTILLAGGSSANGALGGPFYLYSHPSASTRNINIGALFASIDRLPAATQVVLKSLNY